MTRTFSDTLVSLGALGVLVGGFVAVDDRVREQVALRLTDAPSKAQMMHAGARVRDLTVVVFDAARDQSLDHAPLMIFVLAASMLLLFMLRTE